MVVMNPNLFPGHWKWFLLGTLPVYVEKPIFLATIMIIIVYCSH